MPSNGTACAVCVAEKNALLQVFTMCKDLFFPPDPFTISARGEKLSGRGSAGAISGVCF